MNELLNDYRCECGKLLLRGLVLSGEIEIKCKYCKCVKTLLGIQSIDTGDRFVLILASNGIILKASKGTGFILGYPHKELLQRNIRDVLVSFTDDYFDGLCGLLDKKGKTVLLLQSFTRKKTGEMMPTQISVSRFVSADSHYILLDIERKTVRNRLLTLGENSLDVNDKTNPGR